MVREEIPSYRLSGLAFGIYSSDEIQKLSVKEITNPQTFDALMHPTHGGLYDPALGIKYNPFFSAFNISGLKIFQLV